MDLRDRIEVYIPAKAEVKSIPLWSLPNSVLRRMGLPLSDAHGSEKLTDSPTAVWICPAVVRRRSRKPSPCSGHGAVERVLSLLSRECRASPGPFRMSFAFSNRTAYEVLKDAVPGGELPVLPPRASSLPRGLASRAYCTAVVVSSGRIYLSVRKPSRSLAGQETVPAAPPPGLPAQGRFKSQKKDLLNEKKKPKKRLASCKVTQSPNKKGVARTVRGVSSSMTAGPGARSTVGVHSVDGCCNEDAGVSQTPEDVVVQQSDWLQPQEEVADSGAGGRAAQGPRSEEGDDQSGAFDGNAQVSSAEVNRSSWTRREPLSAAWASTSSQSEADLKELAGVEEIARTKARLKHNASFLTGTQSERAAV